MTGRPYRLRDLCHPSHVTLGDEKKSTLPLGEDEEKSTFLFNDRHFLPSLEICAERSSILLKRCDTGVTGSLQSSQDGVRDRYTNKLFSERLTDEMRYKFCQLGTRNAKRFPLRGTHLSVTHFLSSLALFLFQRTLPYHN
ncbi:hypothetical protein TNIN_292201 [Trichonephila inaurata madagascariensis]|uniref:Uncharacterized protein n=1 Tax=Trichonephila inaurata madagascariensis TaxID=2747483 RepID=A0A8X6MJ24_9ARAC|nr:hypothetical protein TNIN_292201 [Trichonephila inaurata madagascariensis]